jgi:AraC family transcriptional regulator
MLHLYVSRRAFQRAVVETVGADPDRVTLREISYFRDPLVEAIMRQAILPLNWNEPAERVAVSHAAQTMLAYLVCRMTERDPLSLRASGGLSPAALRNVTDFIHAYIGEPLSITDLAACCRLSPYHFSRAFKQSTGETPHAFVLRRRIAHAREALTNGMSLSQTATLCGFSSQSHFTERFRAQTGVTPGQFIRDRSTGRSP